MTTVRVAIVQQSPAVLDLAEGVRRAVTHVESAAAEGARLAVFPETWLTAYPSWIFDLAGWDSSEARHWYGRLVSESATIDGDDLVPLRRAAERLKVTVVLGMNERSSRGSGTLYNTLLTIGPDGKTVGVHRKLIPTHTERIVWAQAPDASGLRVHDTAVGRLGGLICWEHWQPLIRYAMHAQNEQIHVAAWPNIADMEATVARTYAFEGRCFVIAAAQYLIAEDVPTKIREAFRRGIGPEAPEAGVWYEGGSAIAGPDGYWLAPPLVGKPGIVLADLDLDLTIDFKHDLDVSGHYNRPDIFNLTVDRRRRGPIAWVDESLTMVTDEYETELETHNEST